MPTKPELETRMTLLFPFQPGPTWVEHFRTTRPDGTVAVWYRRDTVALQEDLAKLTQTP